MSGVIYGIPVMAFLDMKRKRTPIQDRMDEAELCFYIMANEEMDECVDWSFPIPWSRASAPSGGWLFRKIPLL